MKKQAFILNNRIKQPTSSRERKNPASMVFKESKYIKNIVLHRIELLKKSRPRYSFVCSCIWYLRSTP